MALSCGEGGATGAEIVTEINQNTADILELQNQNGFASVTTSGILDVPDTFTEVAVLSVNNLPVGSVHILNMSSTYSFDTTNKSAIVQFTINSRTPEVFSKENKDVTDVDGFYYAFPYTVAAGEEDLVVKLEFRKEDENGTLDVNFANIWLDRKS